MVQLRSDPGSSHANIRVIYLVVAVRVLLVNSM